MNLIDLYSNPPVKLSFGKGYQLSIINTGYGAEQGLYEIGAFKDGDFVELPGITEPGDTVKGWLTKEEVDGIILKMSAISGTDPVNTDAEGEIND
jgi:hypothetical protein